MAANAQGKPSAADFTATKAAALRQEHEAELKARDEEIALTAAREKAEAETTVLDVTKRPEIPTVVDEVSVVDDDQGVVIRVNEDIQQMTVGDKNYDFIAGRKYKVPANVAFHLEEKGRLWH